MKDWKGCRGLDPHVAQYVTNAMPPYLIANESKSPFPFSATNSSSMKHPGIQLDQPDLEVVLPPNGLVITPSTNNDNSTSADTTPQHKASQTPSPPIRTPHPYATCWEILTLELGRFAREHMEKHGSGSVTDAMLQSSARRILYDADDPWEQTAADNPEWLNLFRKAHGMDLTRPQAIANEYSHHEVLEDLGLGANARLDESFNLDHFGCIANQFNDPVARARAFECNLTGKMSMSKAGESSVLSTHMPSLTTSATTSGASNLPTTTLADYQGLDGMADDFSGTGAGGFCLGTDGEFHATTAPFSQGLNSFMTPISEMDCNVFDQPIDTTYGFPALDTTNVEFDMAVTSAALGTNLPTTSCFDDINLGGATENMTMMAWDDDADLTFNMDMDLDTTFR